MWSVIRRCIHDTQGHFRVREFTHDVCPTITVGVGGWNSEHYVVEEYLTDRPPEEKMKVDKPPYRVPSMEEIRAVMHNGLKVVSTFSGAGGSCLGYRMAGFQVLWASEFVPAAQEVYKLNHPDSILSEADIREVTPDSILSDIGLEVGDLDLLDGSPPCSSFSMSGKLEKGWGKKSSYSETEQRTDDLFWEYARILEGLKPKVFIAENVAGLVKGRSKGYFIDIFKLLQSKGYNVQAKLLNAKWLGVPQSRERIFFVGVRSDLGLEPVFPSPLPYFYTVRDAIPWIRRHGTDPPFTKFRESGATNKERLERSLVDSDINVSPCIYADPQKGVGEVEADADISGYAIATEWDQLKPGKTSDKYLNLSKPDPDRACPTITQTGGITGAASVTHPTERRKFSIAELRRIQAFPDDFQLTGNYKQQWERLGRSVPPVMMFHLASAVRDGIFKKLTMPQAKAG